MYPNTYLQTFWRLEFKPLVFVAMNFDPYYQSRFENIIAPAIRSITIDDISLQPYRVDLSKSGDSILTDINDGIAHSRIVLADVSSIGKDSETGQPYRNANVMYEVGIALACRQPHEILLIRDDNDKFLFDVSTIPHKQINFTNTDKAIKELRDELLNRLRETDHVNDARIKIAIAGLTGGEIGLLKHMASLPPNNAWGLQKEGNLQGLVSIPRLLDKQLIHYVGEFEEGFTGYQPTPLGYIVAKLIDRDIRKLKSSKTRPIITKNENQENKGK